MNGKIIVLFFVMTLSVELSAQYKIRTSVIANGATPTSSQDRHISGTIGQSLIGTVMNQANTVQNGFWAQTGDLVTSVTEYATDDGTIPKEFRLEQNYPNPFNPHTTIRFAVPRQSHVTIKLYDILGRRVATLVDAEMEPGEHQLRFDAGGLASGVYLYRLQAERFVQTRKLTLLK